MVEKTWEAGVGTLEHANADSWLRTSDRCFFQARLSVLSKVSTYVVLTPLNLALFSH